MTATNSTVRRGRARRWATAPLVAAIAAGAVCAGVGVGSAAATTTPTDVGAETSGPADLRVTNATEMPIDVTVYKMRGKDQVGELFATGLAPNKQAYGRMDDDAVNNYTKIAVCLNHLLYTGAWETAGHKWNDLYVFRGVSPVPWDGNVFVTGTGGGDNQFLTKAEIFGSDRC